MVSTSGAASIALNRFGLGARPGDAPPGDAKRWLTDQLDRYQPRPPALADAPTTATVAGALATFYEAQKAMRAQGAGPARPAMPPAMTAPPTMDGADAMSGMATPPAKAKPQRSAAQQEARQVEQRARRGDYVDSVAIRTRAALQSDTPFVERLVHFWSNHFAVSADKLELLGLAGPFEFEAIRPHVLGRFSDMLAAVERHPAMLIYLDQAVSVGPNSVVGARIAGRGRRTVGLNENLARETMELHTLGVRTGYTQADVTELARALTGWTVAGIGRGPGANAMRGAARGSPGAFVFVPQVHEPGDRTIRGKSYPAGGVEQGQAVLADLAVAPATARHIATKLSRHFAGDTPPTAMVARLEQAFIASRGDLPTVYRALIDSPEAWTAQPVKFKTPWEWTLSSYRALGVKDVQPGAIVGLLNQLGQPIWKPGQPVGYDDITASWAGPDAVMRRVEAAERFAARGGGTIDARALAVSLFPGAVSAPTMQALSRAESPQQAVALMLVAPEMMRR